MSSELRIIDKAMEGLSDKNLLLSFVKKHGHVTEDMIRDQFPSSTGVGTDPNILSATTELIKAGLCDFKMGDDQTGIYFIKKGSE